MKPLTDSTDPDGDNDDDNSDEDNVAKGTNKLTLDKLSLDNVYLRYLTAKAKQREEEAKNPSKHKKRFDRRGSTSLRRPTKKDFLKLNVAKAGDEDTRKKSLSRRGSGSNMSMYLNDAYDEQDYRPVTPSLTPTFRNRRTSLQAGATAVKFSLFKDLKNDNSSLVNIKEGGINPLSEESKEEDDDDDNEKESELSKKGGHELLMGLIRKNVKLTAEQRALHEAYKSLMEEYNRRKQQRQKTGIIFKRARNKIRDMISISRAWGDTTAMMALSRKGAVQKKESDLQLKSRSQFLQQRRQKKRGGANTKADVAFEDADRI